MDLLESDAEHRKRTGGAVQGRRPGKKGKSSSVQGEWWVVWGVREEGWG